MKRTGRYLLCSLGLMALGVVGELKAQKLKKRDNVSFVKHELSKEYLSEGVAVADVNKDGKMDILAGAFWFEAPHWTRREISPAQVWPANTYGNSFLNFTMDVNQDGWVDFIRVDHPGHAAVWYENPKNKPGHWKAHELHTSVGNESPLFVDVDGDGRMDIICNDSKAKQVIWLKSPSQKGDTKWQKIVISNDSQLATHQYTHGLGFDDLNGDGKKDVLSRYGWWESPKDPMTENWKFHPENFGEECAQMYVFDFNQDGLVDIVSSSAHKYGIWWYEQGRDATGKATWTAHEIDKSFSQTHGLAFVDMNGDGVKDLVTGKRYFAHNGVGDPGEHDPAYLNWYEVKLGKNPTFTKHEIDNNSGVGLHLVVQDMNKDKIPDIVIGNKKGVYYFEQVNPSKKKK